MPVFKQHVIEDTLSTVKVVYLDRSIARVWNERRHEDDVVALCGWFWVSGKQEGGPFRTRSAAIRDAYYRFVLDRDVPAVGRQALQKPARKPINARKPIKQQEAAA